MSTDPRIHELAQVLRKRHFAARDDTGRGFGYDLLVTPPAAPINSFIVTWKGKFYVVGEAFCMASHPRPDGPNTRIELADAGPFEGFDVALATFYLLHP